MKRSLRKDLLCILSITGKKGDTTLIKVSSIIKKFFYFSVGAIYQQHGPYSFHSNYYGKKPAPLPPPQPVCEYQPRQECSQVPREECRQVPRQVTKEVCIQVPTSEPRQECRQVPRQECDIRESSEVYEQCSVIPQQLPSRSQVMMFQFR